MKLKYCIYAVSKMVRIAGYAPARPTTAKSDGRIIVPTYYAKASYRQTCLCCECESCHATFIHYNSCKNRHCPMCQGMDVDEWIDLRREDVLDAPYFHTVFSIPSQLYPLVYANQKLLYDALYHGANKTLTELSGDPKHFGASTTYINAPNVPEN